LPPGAPLLCLGLFHRASGQMYNNFSRQGRNAPCILSPCCPGPRAPSPRQQVPWCAQGASRIIVAMDGLAGPMPKLFGQGTGLNEQACAFRGLLAALRALHHHASPSRAAASLSPLDRQPPCRWGAACSAAAPPLPPPLRCRRRCHYSCLRSSPAVRPWLLLAGCTMQQFYVAMDSAMRGLHAWLSPETHRFQPVGLLVGGGMPLVTSSSLSLCRASSMPLPHDTGTDGRIGLSHPHVQYAAVSGLYCGGAPAGGAPR
jgi:hypothetical protein